MDDCIYLTIAGFTLAVRFHATEWPFSMERSFRDQMYYHYPGFISKKPPKKIDYYIDVISRRSFEVVIQTRKKKYYMQFYEEGKGNTITTFYHISGVQFQLILRKILQRLLVRSGGMIFHASASLVDDSAYIFLGKSGAGKSTVTDLLSLKYPSLADDNIILKEENRMFYFYQTPFLEKNFWIEKSSKGYPLKKIFFLQKASFYRIEKLDNKEHITRRFLDQFLTEEEDAKRQMPNVLKFIARFDQFYFLYFGLQSVQDLIQLVEGAKGY